MSKPAFDEHQSVENTRPHDVKMNFSVQPAATCAQKGSNYILWVLQKDVIDAPSPPGIHQRAQQRTTGTW
ncbi:MAG: hypothetical protein PHN51_01360 [Candidatus Nanopelagicales bacterium]|nr:hypothetical protein [Candidatus Nanopelagicales bacterium]